MNSNVSLDIYKNQYDISIESASENDDSQIFDDNRIGALCQKSMMLFLIAPKVNNGFNEVFFFFLLQQDSIKLIFSLFKKTFHCF